MVKVKAIKNSIEIKYKPLVPYDFKYKLLTKLSFNYILKSDGKRLLKIDKNEITEEEKNKSRLSLYSTYFFIHHHNFRIHYNH